VLLERNHELDVLAASLEAARNGSGRFILVEGVAGIGKTQLLTEARSQLTAAGFRLLSARGVELERDFSFGVVRQLFESTVTAADEEERRYLLSGAAGQATAVVGGDVAAGAEQHGDFAALHGLYWFMANLCQDQPVALLIDDAHWADVGSLRFLAHLLPRIEDLSALVIVGMRPNEAGPHQHVLDHLAADSACSLLNPAPLTPDSAAVLLRARFAAAGGVQPDAAFLAACHASTQGNPLLLQELAGALIAEGVTPVADNVAAVESLGARALHRRVGLWLARVSIKSRQVARALAVLGEQAPLGQVASLAGLSVPQASRAFSHLAAVGILRTASGKASATSADFHLEFVHPLVRATVYDGIDPADRIATHQRAAALLEKLGADDERVAAHLLRLPPAGDPHTGSVLRRAGSAALADGFAGTAVTYLERCRQEPPPAAERLEVLHELGCAAQLIDDPAAAGYLREALSLATEPLQRAEIGHMLGTEQYALWRTEEAVATWQQALKELPAEEPDLRRLIESTLLVISLLEPSQRGLAHRLVELRDLEPHASVGGRSLDCVIALHEAVVGDPHAVSRALRGLEDGLPLRGTCTASARSTAWSVLAWADREEVTASLDAAIAEWHHLGSSSGSASLMWRGMVRLLRGQLADAEADLRDAVRIAAVSKLDLRRAFCGPFLADALMEQGHLAEAQAVLDWAAEVPQASPRSRPSYLLTDSRARLLLARGEYVDALRLAVAAGRQFSADGGTNPSIVPWRSEAALCLHTLGREEEALTNAEEEVRLARRWSAPRALGRALRVAGLVTGGRQGMRLLGEAVDVLSSSPARLEHAKALVDAGAALRRAGARTEARGHLTEGRRLAEVCGAAPLAEQARVELRAAGDRVRGSLLTGLAALTPTERRVAELAATDRTNREIAQMLFVTVKTVETHLGNAYHKLGVRGRRQLAEQLGGQLAATPS